MKVKIKSNGKKMDCPPHVWAAIVQRGHADKYEVIEGSASVVPLARKSETVHVPAPDLSGLPEVVESKKKSNKKTDE